VALSIDSVTGSVLGFRIFPSLIGPVFSLDVETANEIMEGVGYKKGIYIYMHVCMYMCLHIQYV
jgi:hypothetical protein